MEPIPWEENGVPSRKKRGNRKEKKRRRGDERGRERRNYGPSGEGSFSQKRRKNEETKKPTYHPSGKRTRSLQGPTSPGREKTLSENALVGQVPLPGAGCKERGYQGKKKNGTAKGRGPVPKIFLHSQKKPGKKNRNKPTASSTPASEPPSALQKGDNDGKKGGNPKPYVAKLPKKKNGG